MSRGASRPTTTAAFSTSSGPTTPRWLIYLQDTQGDENWHIHRVDLDDPDAAAVNLTPPFPGAMAAPLREVRNGTTTVMLNNRDATQFDVHELDIVTGELTLIAENPPGRVYTWMSSDKGDLFATSLTPPGGDLELSRWDGAALHPITRFDGTDYPMGIHPMVVTPEGTGLWMGSYRGSDHTRLVRVDLTTGEETEVDSHPEFDLDPRAIVSPAIPAPLIQDRRTSELLGVRYFGERQVIRALDPQFRDILANLEKLSDGGHRASLIGPDRPALGRRFQPRPGPRRHLPVRPRHRREPTAVPAAAAPGSRPIGRHAAGHDHRTRRLAVALLSDPPACRSSPPRVYHWCSSYTAGRGTATAGVSMPGVQMLANRGYAVLQVNFRGSMGFGKAFLSAAKGEFAGKMHNDLIDGGDLGGRAGLRRP